MIAPVFQICSASVEVTNLLGTNPVRLYPFGLVPQQTPAPYAVWQNIGGSPENYLATLPDADSYSVQIDVYGANDAQALAVADALKDALEPEGYITGWGNTLIDFDTKLYRFNFSVDLIANR